MNVLLVCIAFGNHDQVRGFLNHIMRIEKGANLRILVVDNTPGARLREEAWLGGECLEEWSSGNVLVVGDGENRGYFGGFRFGLSASASTWEIEFDWTVLCNTDLEISSANWLSSLAGCSDGVAVVAPRITSMLTLGEQNPIYAARPSARKFLVLSWLFRSTALTAAHRLASLVKRRLRAKGGAKSGGRAREIYAAHGSFICLSKSYFDRGGALHCPTFLFCEEIFLAEEVAMLGMSIRYVPEIHVLHREHATTSFVPPAHIRGHLADAHRATYRLLAR